jgi:hypothetical protein
MGRALRRFMLLTALPLVVSTSAHAAVCHPSHVHHATAHKVAMHTAGGLGVVIDQARLISFPKPVKTVYVANPTVVDITMIDSRHAFLLGKTFGMTNMIALAPDGGQISNQQVTVLNNAAAVTVNRGADQFDYMCTRAHCETAPRPGDPNGFVTNTEGAASTHESTGSAAGTNAPVGQTASAQ